MQDRTPSWLTIRTPFRCLASDGLKLPAPPANHLRPRTHRAKETTSERRIRELGWLSLGQRERCPFPEGLTTVLPVLGSYTLPSMRFCSCCIAAVMGVDRTWTYSLLPCSSSRVGVWAFPAPRVRTSQTQHARAPSGGRPSGIQETKHDRVACPVYSLDVTTNQVHATLQVPK